MTKGTNMKHLTALVLILSSSLVYGQDYSCHAQANPNRGFNMDFDIQVTPAAVGGQIILSTGGKQRPLGALSEVGSIDKSNVSQKEAFDMTLGLIGESDVSGIQAGDLKNVSSINILKETTADGDEIIIFQLFESSTQIGGTFMASGLGTACRPK